MVDPAAATEEVAKRHIWLVSTWNRWRMRRRRTYEYIHASAAWLAAFRRRFEAAWPGKDLDWGMGAPKPPVCPAPKQFEMYPELLDVEVAVTDAESLWNKCWLDPHVAHFTGEDWYAKWRDQIDARVTAFVRASRALGAWGTVPWASSKRIEAALAPLTDGVEAHAAS